MLDTYPDRVAADIFAYSSSAINLCVISTSSISSCRSDFSITYSESSSSGLESGRFFVVSESSSDPVSYLNHGFNGVVIIPDTVDSLILVLDLSLFIEIIESWFFGSFWFLRFLDI